VCCGELAHLLVRLLSIPVAAASTTAAAAAPGTHSRPVYSWGGSSRHPAAARALRAAAVGGGIIARPLEVKQNNIYLCY